MFYVTITRFTPVENYYIISQLFLCHLHIISNANQEQSFRYRGQTAKLTVKVLLTNSLLNLHCLLFTIIQPAQNAVVAINHCLNFCISTVGEGRGIVWLNTLEIETKTYDANRTITLSTKMGIKAC